MKKKRGWRKPTAERLKKDHTGCGFCTAGYLVISPAGPPEVSLSFEPFYAQPRVGLFGLGVSGLDRIRDGRYVLYLGRANVNTVGREIYRHTASRLSL